MTSTVHTTTKQAIHRKVSSLAPCKAAACALIMTGAMLVFSGCANNAQSGALVGGMLGAGTGAIIGHQSGEAWAGAGIGAAAGALGGYIVGNEIDKDDRRYHSKRHRHSRHHHHGRYDY